MFSLIVFVVIENVYFILYYCLVLLDGEDIVSIFNENLVILQFGQGQLVFFFEVCLLGLFEGMQQIFELSFVQVFGECSEELIQCILCVMLEENFFMDEDYCVGDLVDFVVFGGGCFVGIL